MRKNARTSKREIDLPHLSAVQGNATLSVGNLLLSIGVGSDANPETRARQVQPRRSLEALEPDGNGQGGSPWLLGSSCHIRWKILESFADSRTNGRINSWVSASRTTGRKN